MLIDLSIPLNPAQQFILDAKLLETGFSCVLQLPTGTGKTWMAKLRRDMFDWFYSEKMEIYDYDKAGRDEIEDQERFDWSFKKIFTGCY